MSSSIQEKQAVLRQRIMDEGYDAADFLSFIQLFKGDDLNNYTLEDLDEIIEKFIQKVREEKQQYLRENILEANYNIQEFLDFMNDQKINGNSIDNWDLEELKEVVYDFKNRFDQKFIQNETQDQKYERLNRDSHFLTQSMIQRADCDIDIVPDDEEIRAVVRFSTNRSPKKMQLDKISEDLREENWSEQKSDSQLKREFIEKSNKLTGNQDQPYLSPYMENTVSEFQKSRADELTKTQMKQWDDLQKKKELEEKMSYVFGKGYQYKQPYFERKLECYKETSRLPKNNKLKIMIPRWEKRSSGFLGLGSTIYYEIQVEPYKWNVHRSLNDFQLFRKALCNIFPGRQIPPLDNNTHESDNDQLRTRSRFLVEFLNHLKRWEEIWSNAFTLSFLSDEEGWAAQHEKLQERGKFERCVSSMTGELNLRLQKLGHVYQSEVSDYVGEITHDFAELQQQSLKIGDMFRKLSFNINNLKETHSKLIQKIQNFNIQLSQKVPESDELSYILQSNKALEQSYKNMSTLVQGFAKSTKQQGLLMDQMHLLFKYQQLDLNNFTDIQKEYTQSEKDYLHFRQEQEKQLTKSQCNQEAAVKLKQKEKQKLESYAYWQEIKFQEGQKLIDNQMEDYVKMFNYFSRFEALRINELIKTYSKTVDQYFVNPFPQPRNQELSLQMSMVKKF